MVIAENKAVVQAFDELGDGTGDRARLDALCTADLINHALAPHMPPGVEGTRMFLGQGTPRPVSGALGGLVGSRRG
jgi:hypothetical protein